MVRCELLRGKEVDVPCGAKLVAFHSSFLCTRAFSSGVMEPQFQIAPLVGSQV